MMVYLSVLVKNNRIELVQLHGELETAIRYLIELSYHAIDTSSWDARIFTGKGYEVFEYPLFEAEKAIDQGLSAEQFAQSVLALTDTERLELLAKNNEIITLGHKQENLNQFSNKDLRKRYEILSSTFDELFTEETDPRADVERYQHMMRKLRAALEDSVSLIDDASLTSEELTFTLRHNLGLLLTDLNE